MHLDITMQGLPVRLASPDRHPREKANFLYSRAAAVIALEDSAQGPPFCHALLTGSQETTPSSSCSGAAGLIALG